MAKMNSFRLLAACLMLPTIACFSLDHTGFHKQKLRVLTQPSGTMIWLEDEEGRREMGEAPIELELEHRTSTIRFNHALWLTAIPPIAGLAGGIAWRHYSPSDEEERVYMLIGLGAAGLLASVIACIVGENRSGADHVDEVLLIAEKDGYLTEGVSVPYPYPDDQLEISLAASSPEPPEPSRMEAMQARIKELPRIFVSAYAGYQPFAAFLHFPVDMGNRLVVGGDIGIRAVSGFIVGPSFQCKWSDMGDGYRFLNAGVRLGYIFPFNSYLHMMAGAQIGYLLLTEKEDPEESGTKNQWHGIFLSPLVDLRLMANRNFGFSLAAGLNLEFFDFFPVWGIHIRGGMVVAF